MADGVCCWLVDVPVGCCWRLDVAVVADAPALRGAQGFGNGSVLSVRGADAGSEKERKKNNNKNYDQTKRTRFITCAPSK